ncbi:hypothetical protein ACIPYU_13415 [Paenarthrobacter nicotinovorans]|uniref:hypothetical protein n=1 Tax=Paenarthrobacter nicotinovorans TaxID=29320 RepID=UPI003812FCF0
MLETGSDGPDSAIHLRELGRRDIHLRGHRDAIGDGATTFSDDLPQRLTTVEQG